MPQKEYQPIENYGVIGDLRTVALVGIDGSIDFMCFPNFDSPSIFAGLLDTQKGGFFQITTTVEDIKKKQLYLPETNILLTRFLSEEGIGEIRDFMPISTQCTRSLLVRKVTNIKGEITYRMQCSPRFNYARSSHKAKLRKNELIFQSEGKEKLCLRLVSSIPLQIKKGDAFAEFTLKAGESAEFILEIIKENEASLDIDAKEFAEKSFIHTLNYWKAWSAKCTYNGRWREMVIRSALVLKLLISQQFGSIVAAPTFSLPEKIEGNKNWDYRFAWIRDSAFTIYALMLLGYKEEAENFKGWIEKLCTKLGKQKNLSPLYNFDGRQKFNEIELSHLEGYKKSSPVRIGNAASEQLQIDIYGEFIDSIYLYDKYVSSISHDNWTGLSKQISWVQKNWKKKDSGIWETRGKPQQFLTSRFMCWVALDRAIRIGTKNSYPFPCTWIKTRDEIYNSIFKEFWNEKLQAFVQSKNSKEVDASTLLMPLIRFIGYQDPKWLSTLKRIEENLATDCLVYRYRPENSKLFGLNEGEGNFSACSFWFIECLSRAGELQKAQVYFDKMLSYANHLGLYSEQLGGHGEHLGNFPQAFTHLALISAAYDLNKRLNR